MSGHWGILVSDPCLQNQFTQVELRSLKNQVSVVYLCYNYIQLLNLNESHVLISLKDWIFNVVIEIENLGHVDRSS
jgi:hypothetical protein